MTVDEHIKTTAPEYTHSPHTLTIPLLVRQQRAHKAHIMAQVGGAACVHHHPPQLVHPPPLRSKPSPPSHPSRRPASQGLAEAESHGKAYRPGDFGAGAETLEMQYEARWQRRKLDAACGGGDPASARVAVVGVVPLKALWAQKRSQGLWGGDGCVWNGGLWNGVVWSWRWTQHKQWIEWCKRVCANVCVCKRVCAQTRVQTANMADAANCCMLWVIQWCQHHVATLFHDTLCASAPSCGPGPRCEHPLGSRVTDIQTCQT